MPQVVMVTGVARELAGRVLRHLAESAEIERVIGVDLLPPRGPIGRAEFIRADVRSPLVARMLDQAKVDTVVHMGVIATPRDAGGRVVQKDINVLGTMQLLASCQRADSVRRLVVKSTAGVYGASSRDPAVFTEDMAAKVVPRSAFARDSMEVEGYVRGVSRRRPDISVTTLRMANVIGPSIRTVLTDYFTLPVLPVPLGYDGRLQFLHEDDAVHSMVRAVHADGVDGAVNVAGGGVVATTQAVALTRRPWVPVARSLAAPTRWGMRRLGLAALPADHLDFLAYGRVLDTTRMRRDLGFEPAYTSLRAFTSFLQARRDGDRHDDRSYRVEGAP